MPDGRQYIYLACETQGALQRLALSVSSLPTTICTRKVCSPSQTGGLFLCLHVVGENTAGHAGGKA